MLISYQSKCPGTGLGTAVGRRTSAYRCLGASASRPGDTRGPRRVSKDLSVETDAESIVVEGQGGRAGLALTDGYCQQIGHNLDIDNLVDLGCKTCSGGETSVRLEIEDLGSVESELGQWVLEETAIESIESQAEIDLRGGCGSDGGGQKGRANG